MKEMVEMPRVMSDNRKCLDSELRVIMPSVLLPAAPKFKWGDFDEEDANAGPVGTTNGNVVTGKDHIDLEHGGQEQREEEGQGQAQQQEQRQEEHEQGHQENTENSRTQSIEDHAAEIASPSSSGTEATTATPMPAAAGTGQNPSLDISLAANMLMKRFTGGSIGESKERFRQRLWCYLFENLNRAIDELYFLCELECDMEQIQEALLVFNEAGLDFRELKARVENFETLKESGKSVDNDSAKLEQRPHAIAWEVRRMASSPRRADILSLSLEAFKKVQLGGNKQESMQQTKRRDAARFLSFEQAMKQKPEAEISTSTSTTQTKSKIMTGDHQNQKQSMPCCQPRPTGTTDASAPAPPPDSSPCSGEPPPPTIHLAEETRKCEEEEEEEEEEDRDDVKSTSSTCDKMPSAKTALEAWKEKRNWEDILSSPLSSASRTSGSPVVGRKSTERGRVLHDKLMSPERKKKTPMEMKKEVDEKQARATRIRRELENERALRLQRTTEKLNRVSEWQAVRSSKLREGMHARQQRGESRHEAHLAQIARRASDESSKVSEVRFITSLNEENKKLSLQQKLQDSELRRAERLQNLRIKQKEDVAREEAALERRKLLEAERLQRIAETQRKKEEAQARREEERKAANAAREARAVEQVRKKEVRAKAQEEEVELLRQKLAERLRESALRRKIYLEQIRERAVMDTRDQGSPLSRRPSSREGQTRIIGGQSNEAEMVSEREMNTGRLVKVSPNAAGTTPDGNHQALKKRIKKIRQRLTTRRFDYIESDAAVPVTPATRTKLGRWVQELQRLQQARKAGASATVLIIAEIIKYLEGKDIELHVARHTGLLDFIATAVPASHTSKPEASQTTVALLKVLVVLLSLPANRSYFLARNLLPPLIPILSTALENYSSVGCSVGGTVKEEKVIPDEKFDAVGEVLEDLLKCVTLVMGHTTTDERQQQMQDDLVELIVACDVIHRLRNLFALFDRPQMEGAPFPPPVLLGLKLLDTLTRGKTVATSVSSSMAAQFLKSVPVSGAAAGIKRSADAQQEKEKVIDNLESAECDNEALECTEKPGRCCMEPESKPESQSTENDRVSRSLFLSQDMGAPQFPDSISNREESKRHFCTSKSVGFLLVAIAETGLIGLPSLLTAVLLQANPRASTPEQAASSLPLNFEEVATSVLRVLNNTACLDLSLVQTMLAMPDLKMEFFHLVSFLLSYCTCKWKAATDQVASLLLETLLLLGYFALLHPGNQAVLRWGKSPTILHKLCDLPFAFFSDPELTPILVGTFLAACYGSERNRDVVQQELSMELLISVLKSSKRQNDNFYKAGVQSAEALLSKPQVKRMDVITEESEEEMQRSTSNTIDNSEERVLAEEVPACSGTVTSNSSLATRRHGKIETPEAPAASKALVHQSKKPRAAARDKQLPGVFLLENRFPSSLWENAIDFFSLR